MENGKWKMENGKWKDSGVFLSVLDPTSKIKGG